MSGLDLGSPTFWVAALIAAGVAALLLSVFLASRTGLSSRSEVMASDTGQNRVKKLWDPETGLVGQPDYILRERVGFSKKLVPVEVKPTRKGTRLHHSDEMQSTVYMLLMRAEYGKEFAGYAYVRYKEKTFRVRLTRELERLCLQYVGEIRQARQAHNVHRNHDQRVRCLSCAYRPLCDESLA